jgi:hypothetical protein
MLLNSKEEESEGEIQFMRTITSSDASEYRIDGKKVPEKEYQAKLKSIGLLVKSRNFLVFQNEVEKIAQKSPKELTELIERVSGSEVSPENNFSFLCLTFPFAVFFRKPTVQEVNVEQAEWSIGNNLFFF